MEEIEEIAEEQKHVTTTMLKIKAVGYLVVGIVLVAVFTSPMVDIHTALGEKLNISPFYVAFIASPVLSNMPELFSTASLARKRTAKSITGCFQQLFAGAALNNTLVLSLLLGVIYFRKLHWCFWVEVIAVVLVEVVVAILSTRRVVPLWQGLVPVLLYPLSIAFVAGLQYSKSIPQNDACSAY